MPRHSKNNTAHSIFTYHERKMVNYVGTMKERLGSDSMRRFEQCWLCLSTAEAPVVTPQGFIFCRSCILENLYEQSQQRKKQRAMWHQYCAKRKREETDEQAKEENIRIKRFVESETHVPTANGKKSNRSLDTLSDEKLFVPTKYTKEESRAKNFWVAENTPTASEQPVEGPKQDLLCPISKCVLKTKDLFTLNPEVSAENNETRWICSISKKLIGHQKAVAVLPTKQIVLLDYVDKFIFGDKSFYSREITSKDLIPIIPGGTGFSSHNRIESERYRAPLQ